MRSKSCFVLLFSMMSSTVAAKSPSGRLAGTVEVIDGGSSKGDKSGIVVHLESAPVRNPAPAPRKFSIRQKNQAFDPLFLVLVKGDQVEFPNEDRIFHNVFSVSKSARFDLGLYKEGDTKSVTMTRAGVIDVFCNIHPQMIAKIKVLENDYYVVTDESGRFAIESIPPGTYSVVAWSPRGGETKQEVVVKAAQTTAAALKVTESRRSTRHTRKDGTPYGRYQ